jgi:hypothetical protein
MNGEKRNEELAERILEQARAKGDIELGELAVLNIPAPPNIIIRAGLSEESAGWHWLFKLQESLGAERFRAFITQYLETQQGRQGEGDPE